MPVTLMWGAFYKFLLATVLLQSCISEGFGPSIDYGSGPLVGGSNVAVIERDSEPDSDSENNPYIGPDAASSLSRSVPLHGDLGGFLATVAWVGRAKSTWNDNFAISIAVQNTSRTPKCFVYIENLHYLDANGHIIAARPERTYVYGASGVWDTIQINQCIEAGGVGYALTHAQGSYNAVASVHFDAIEFIDPATEGQQWRQPAGALVPQSFTFWRDLQTADSTLSIRVKNTGLEPVVADLILSRYVILSANDMPIYHGGFSSLLQKTDVVLPGDSIDLVDTQFIVPFDGPLVRLWVSTSFVDDSVRRANEAGF